MAYQQSLWGIIRPNERHKCCLTADLLLGIERNMQKLCYPNWKKLIMMNIIIITTILDLNGEEVSNTKKKTNIYSILSLTFFFFSRLTGEALSPWMTSPYWGRAVNLKHERSAFLSPVLLGVSLCVCLMCQALILHLKCAHNTNTLNQQRTGEHARTYRHLRSEKKRHTCLYLLHTCTFVLMWRLPLT